MYVYIYFYVYAICAGVFACYNVEETSNATKDEEHRVVDEEEALAGWFQTASAQLRAPMLGRHARR